MEEILTAYYENNAAKLHGIVDKIILRFGGLSDKDRDDFYSLANEVFADVIKRYHGSQSFEGFLYSCLSKKIKTEITKRNREKRRAERLSISIYTPIEDDEDSTIEDTIAADYSVEEELFEKGEAGYSKKMRLYLSKLSDIQKSVLRLHAAGYLPDEIRKELHISKKEYADCYAAIRSYRNVSVLF